MRHYPTCTANYPEKVKHEAPRQIVRDYFDGFYVDTCVDCGATEDNFPPEDDPYWDEAKRSLGEGER